MLPTLYAAFEWVSGDDLWWIVGMGAIFSTLAFVVGARFLTRQPVKAEPQPGAVGDPIANAADKERRVAFRRKGSSVAVQIGELNQPESPHAGWVMDRSVSGLGLWSEKKETIGTQLKVRPTHGPEMTPWVEIEVCSCKEYEGGWQLGCAFVKTPPYSVLLLFG
jgi:hypothetical protein